MAVHEADLQDWEDLPASETADRLAVDRQHGLTEDEAKRRLDEFGPNSIEEEKESFFVRWMR